jgi:hypothetical protein
MYYLMSMQTSYNHHLCICVYHNDCLDQCYETFYIHIYDCLQQARVFFSARPFQPVHMFVGKARSLHKSEAPKRGVTQLDSVFTYKRYTRLEKLAQGQTLAYYEHS